MGLPLIAQDKANHVIYGALASITTHCIARLVVQTPAPAAVAAAAGVAIAVAVGKELVDRRRPEAHTPDWRDAAATAAGGLVACVALALGAM